VSSVKPYSIFDASKALEFDSILDKLAGFAETALGKQRCLELPFLDSPEEVRIALREVSEGRSLAERGAAPSLVGLTDLTKHLKRARVAAVLDARELFETADVLAASRRTRRLLETEAEKVPRLSELSVRLLFCPALEKEIARCIDRDGNVVDSASPELMELRARYRQVHDQVHDVLENLLSNPKYEDALQEPIFSLRSGRFVIPVKIEKKGKIEGIVHDISASGLSLFIEPSEVTGLNNLLRTCELEIEREIYRILMALTYQVAEVADELEATVDTLAELDNVMAKARYSIYANGSAPEVCENGDIDLKSVRHPLLLETVAKVIPNDLRFDPEVRVMVVTGPNTGGKTVLLKSLGICALMLRAGMHIPASPDSRLSFFTRIFAVIGDQQSIERSLSSFSAHILALTHIIEEVTPKSLVLIDELGEGTDPMQGVALAKAVLEKLDAPMRQTLITTHFMELAAMAQAHPHFANASVQFDPVKLEPTYRLVSGVPGRSSAFAIAERLGMPADVVARAKEMAFGQDHQLDALVAKLEEEIQAAKREKERAEKAREQAEAAAEREKKIADELQSKKARYVEEALEGFRKELAEAKDNIREVIRDLQADKSHIQIKKAKEQLERIEKSAESWAPHEADKTPSFLNPVMDWSNLSTGSPLYVGPVGEDGILEEGPDSKGNVKVAVGGKHMTLPASRIFLRRDESARPKTAPSMAVSALADERRTLDLRGFRAEEAVPELIKFLDEALLSRLPQVIVIHGHGTGVLKKEVRGYLSGSPYVRSFRPGVKGEGGDGATIVELDL